MPNVQIVENRKMELDAMYTRSFGKKSLDGESIKIKKIISNSISFCGIVTGYWSGRAIHCRCSPHICAGQLLPTSTEVIASVFVRPLQRTCQRMVCTALGFRLFFIDGGFLSPDSTRSRTVLRLQLLIQIRFSLGSGQTTHKGLWTNCLCCIESQDC